MELRGIEYLRRKLEFCRPRVNLRYKHYAMKNNDTPIGITIPINVRAQYKSTLGWTAKGGDSLADRLVFRKFENDDFEVTEIFEQNNQKAKLQIESLTFLKAWRQLQPSAILN